jgi:hypothetical protein
MPITNLHPIPMPSTTERTERLTRAALLARTALRLLDAVDHEDAEVWEAKCSLLNAVANLRIARDDE